MSQGSINMPAPGRSPVEGIMQALQAVHAYYGIDTQKQQQQLLATQIRAEEPKAAEAEARGSELKNFIEGKGPGPLMMKDSGYIVGPNQPQQNQPTRPQVIPAGNTMAVNDNVSSDAGPGSPLGKFQKISQFSQPEAAPSQPVSKDQWGVRNVSLPNGQTITMEPGLKLREEQQKYQNEVLTGKQKGQEMDIARQKQKEDVAKTFDTDAKELKNNIKIAKEASNALLSGNKISEKIGALRSTLAQLGGLKRASGAVLEAGEPADVESKIENFLEKNSTGHTAPEDLDTLNKSINIFQKSNDDALQTLAGEHSARAADILRLKPEDVQKLLLPKGTGAQYMDTLVDVDPKTGAKELYKVDAKGKRSLIPYDTPTKSYSPLHKAVLGAIGGGTSVAHKLLGGIGGIFGGEGGHE